jgi:hypothetical protein
MHQIYYLSELMQSHKLINVFLDLKAAYDTVDRNILWTLLANRYGIPYHLIRMMRALFDNNKCYLLVGNTRSEPIANHRGVPQGSSIAPTMFNFFINGLIEILEAMPRRENVPSNCLFFADDGNLHSTSSEHVQNLLDVCHEWSTQHGMTFAAQKCLVLARNPTQLTLGSTQLPQVECATYLGIPFKPNGPDWNQAAKKMSQKAQAIVMLLAKKGFNKNTWCPAVKIRVYKLFIRPLMEYGMQCTLYNCKQLKLFEKTQQLALRIAYGVPWNTSKTALKRLSCLESMEFRNHILNSRFIYKALRHGDENIPAVAYMMKRELCYKSLIYKWIAFNPLLNRIINLDSKKMKTEVLLLRYENVKNDTLGHTGVSNAIRVDPSLKLSSVLTWNGLESN